MIDYTLILTINYPGKQWAFNGDTYEGLLWMDASPQPTKAELDELWQATQEHMAKNACKAQAKILLANSDWSAMADVNLANKNAFIAYRSALRNLVINPVESPVFPAEPTPVWS